MADKRFFSPMAESYCPFYRNVCQYCYKDAPPKKCANCKTSWYCSKEHQILAWPSHKKHCKAMKLTNERVPYVVECRKDVARYKGMLCAAWQAAMKRTVTAYEFSVSDNLPVCEVCWKKDGLYECGNCKCVWFCGKEHEEGVRPFHQKYCEPLKLCRLSDLYRTERYDVNEAMSSHATSRINTLIYSLVVLKFLGSSLNVHIVGSAEEEAKSFWDFSPLRSIRLRNINLSFIGPDVVPFKIPPCPQVNVQCEFYKKCYHEVVNDLAKPDILILYNAGLHVYIGGVNMWKPSIPYLVRKGIALVITAYNETEMLQDRKELLDNSKGVKFIVDCIKNPEGSTKPFRDSETFDYTSVFYVNEYVCISRGTI